MNLNDGHPGSGLVAKHLVGDRPGFVRPDELDRFCDGLLQLIQLARADL
jgi:hypothetical protein